METETRIVGIDTDLFRLGYHDRLAEFAAEDYSFSAELGARWSSVDPSTVVQGSYSDYKDIKDPGDAETLAHVYVLPQYMGGSDYSGGFVGKANYKDFLDMMDDETREALSIHEVYGDMGTYAIAIPLWVLLTTECNQCFEREVCAGSKDGIPVYETETELCDLCAMSAEIRETLNALEDYPLINDETLSNLEMEDWDTQYENWGRDEFKGELIKRFPEFTDGLDDTPDESVDELFRRLCEDSGTYPEADGESMYIRMEDLCTEVCLQDVQALDGAISDPEYLDDSEEDRSEDNSRALQGYSHCIVASLRHTFTGEDSSDGGFSLYVKINHMQVLRHTRHENPRLDVYAYRLQYVHEHNETPLFPVCSDSETPNTNTPEN